MKTLAFLALFTSVNAFAFGDIVNNDNSVNPSANASSAANAGAIAGANATGGSAFAKGGSAFTTNKNSNFGVNKQSQGQGQSQGQNQSNKNFNSDYNSNAQFAKQGNEQNLTIESHNEVNAEPAYAPSQSLDVSNQTCLAGVGASLGGGGIFSVGFAGIHEDKQCTYRANLNHITTLYGRDVAKAYAKKYLTGLSEILDPEEEEDDETAYIEVNHAESLADRNPGFNGRI